MKRLFLSSIFIFAVIAAHAAATTTTKTTMQGWVTNTACDARAMKADAAACMRKCKEKGQVQFVDDAKHQVWDVSNPKKLAAFTSTHVRLVAVTDAAGKKLEVVSVKKSREPKNGN